MFSLPALPKKILTALVVTAALTTAAAAAEVSVGTVDASALNMRSSASAGASVITTAPRGDKVIILDQIGNWYKVSYKYREGYMSAEYLIEIPNANLSDSPITGVVTGSVVNVRALPGTSGSVVCQLRKDTAAEIIGTENGWYKIKCNSYTGYIHPDYFAIKEQAEPVKAAASTTSSPAVEGSSEASSANTVSADVNSDLRSQIVEFAKQYIGTKYCSGGRTPSTGFDCSGFVYYVFKNFGYTLNPGASNQMDKVTAIKKAELLPGDLVFFNTGSARRASHVGIYVGDNKFIHAVSPGKTLSISSLSDAYYAKYYVGSGRVF